MLPLRLWPLALVLVACAPRSHWPEGTAGFVYEVSAPGVRSTLLGTIHMGFGLDHVLGPEGRRAFDESRRVWLEADLTRDSQKALFARALLPPGRALRDVIGGPLYDELARAAEPLFGAAQLARVEPWLPALVLATSQLEEELRDREPRGVRLRVDLELDEAAHGAHKELCFLETVEAQIAVFDAMPLDEQVLALRRALHGETREATRALVRAYASGDEAALTRSLFGGQTVRAAPSFHAALLEERNRAWLPTLAREFARGKAFVAVGAAHLMGDTGLLALLRGRGFAVRRLH